MGPDAGGLHLPGLEACTGMLQGGGQSQAAGIIWKNRVWGGPPRRGHHKGGAREEGRGGVASHPRRPPAGGMLNLPPGFPPAFIPSFVLTAAGQRRPVVIGEPNLLDAALRQLHGHF